MPAHNPAAGQPYLGTPLGYQQITPAAATGLTLPAPTPGSGIANSASVAVLCAEGQAVRIRDDGTAPTATVGFYLAVGVIFTYTGNLSALKAIQTTTGGILNVLYY